MIVGLLLLLGVHTLEPGSIFSFLHQVLTLLLLLLVIVVRGVWNAWLLLMVGLGHVAAILLTSWWHVCHVVGGLIRLRSLVAEVLGSARGLTVVVTVLLVDVWGLSLWWELGLPSVASLGIPRLSLRNWRTTAIDCGLWS